MEKDRLPATEALWPLLLTVWLAAAGQGGSAAADAGRVAAAGPDGLPLPEGRPWADTPQPRG